MTFETAQTASVAWEYRRLDEVSTIIDSLHKTPTYSAAGKPMVRVTDIKGGFLDLRETLRVSEDVFLEFIRRYTPKSGDIIISRVGSCGNFSYAETDAPFCLGQNTALISPNINGRYLHLFLQSPEARREIEQVAVGTTQKTISLKSISALQIPVPPPKELEAIAHILGTLDDKIELNRRMNATLEAMARALFQSWFVGFDPVRRNSEGGASRPEDLLFPDSFEDSAIGEIPTGWEVMPLYETATYRNGAPFKPADFCPSGGGLPVIKIAELKSGLTEQTKWSNKQLGSDQMIDTGDLLYSWSGSPDTSLDAFLWSNGPGLVNQHIFKVITSSDAEKRFVYYLLKHLRPILVETARDKQTTGLGHVTVADMKRLQVCRLPKDVLAAFDKLIAPFFDKAFANTVESQTLASLRDTLLPALLSGTITTKK